MENRICPKLYLIGDSNTQLAFNGGFGNGLANEYMRKCDVINRGYSGYTSDHLQLMIPKMLQNDNQPEGAIYAATILLGSNDSVSKELDYRHVPVDKYKENIKFIIEKLQNIHVKHIILLSPPPVDGKAWDDYLRRTKGVPGTYFNDEVRLYADACTEIASNYPIHYLNLYEDMMSLPNWKSYMGDGLHFNALGNTYVCQRLKEILDPIFIHLPMVYPDWMELDPSKL